MQRQTVSEFANEAELVNYYRGKRILIAGAGGSIGSEIAQQLAQLGVGHLLLVDKDENGLYELQVRFAAQDQPCRYELLVADIRFAERIRSIFEQFRPEVVFHAAAHKHVSLMEINPTEAVLNNVFGTRNLIEQAIAHKTSVFVFVSTDKAAEPSSIMGATKRLGELMVDSKRSHTNTRFACVRFGNVIGSRGSVIPLFQKQIAEGGPITLTHPEVYRYFMTIPEAVNLVIRVGILDGREEGIYVLNMGDPFRIADLAHDLIELSGLRPGHDIRIETIGLRPGDKLREQLVGEGAYLKPTKHPRIFVVVTRTQPKPHELEAMLDRLWEVAQRNDVEQIHHLFDEFDFGFQKPNANLTLESTREQNERSTSARGTAESKTDFGQVS